MDEWLMSKEVGTYYNGTHDEEEASSKKQPTKLNVRDSRDYWRVFIMVIRTLATVKAAWRWSSRLKAVFEGPDLENSA